MKPDWQFSNAEMDNGERAASGIKRSNGFMIGTDDRKFFTQSLGCFEGYFFYPTMILEFLYFNLAVILTCDICTVLRKCLTLKLPTINTKLFLPKPAKITGL